MVATLTMTGPGSSFPASTPAEPADHPLRAALARGEAVHALSAPALRHLLAADDHSLIAEAVVAQVRGMLADLSRQLVQVRSRSADAKIHDAMLARLLADDELRGHCQALALEWRLAQKLEAELAIDPVLSALMQIWVAQADAATGSLAMAALAAQARFAQSQRRMQLPLEELTAELLHAALAAAREIIPDGSAQASMPGEVGLRSGYDEAATRLSLLARLAREAAPHAPRAATIEDAGVALWLSVLAARSGESRDRTACATADPHLGRLLLTMRAAGVASTEAERQALRIQPDANLPRGLEDIGTREAAQWLAEVEA